MDTKLILFGTYELLLALIFGLLTIYIALQIVSKFKVGTSFSEAVRQKNFAIALFQGTWVVCTLILVENSILPSVDALRTMVLTKDEFSIGMLGISMLYFIGFYILSIVFSYIMLAIVFQVFIRTTKNIDEVEEMKGNNMAASVLLSIVMLGATLFIHPAYDNFVGSLVNYNKLESIAKSFSDQKKPDGKLSVPKQMNPPD